MCIYFLRILIEINYFKFKKNEFFFFKRTNKNLKILNILNLKSIITNKIFKNFDKIY